MIVAELDRSTLRRQLADRGVCLRTGPVVSRIFSNSERVAAGIELHYARHEVDSEGLFADFDVRVNRPNGIRRFVRPQIRFYFDGRAAFQPLPEDQAFPTLEWGMNWCVSTHCHQYLIIHSAVLECNGRVLIIPAPPGSGKSTLCAGLIHSGWRLFSDELALIEPSTGMVVPIPRPVSLKNASIAVVRRYAPGADIGVPVHETTKGTVAHMRPPEESVARASEAAMPGWVVTPRFAAGAEVRLTPMPKAQAFMKLVDNAFNYDVHGPGGFDTLKRVISNCDAFEFEYERLEDAAEVFRKLALSPPARIS